MSAQIPVGVIPASKTVRRTIEVAVLETTLETVPQTESVAQTRLKAFPNPHLVPALNLDRFVGLS